MKIYYGNETKKALRNFPFSTGLVKEEFIIALVLIKKAAVLANYKVGNINKMIKDAIVSSCDEIFMGKNRDQFVISNFQGGAGTATNMNVNEVLANRATEILKNKKIVRANDDVNCSQSTNDVNPSALRISSFLLLKNLDQTLSSIIKSFEDKSNDFRKIIKLGRTHLQDAIPTTLGREFEAYASILAKHRAQIKESLSILRVLNLGGTAIGNSMNANPIYIKQVYLELNKITNENFVKAKNLMSQTSSQTDFLLVSEKIVALCVDLSKIANDFKFMSSGPIGGIGEIILPELQQGSSIMPGKVNPIMPELVNQLYFLVSGNNLIIEKAVEGAQMELGVMLPIIVDKLIESIKLTTEVINQFDKFCIRGIKANPERCLLHLENSTAYATLLVPRLGYDLVSKIVNESIKEKINLREYVIKNNYMKEVDFDKLINSFLKVL